jgi:hypothetical protein
VIAVFWVLALASLVLQFRARKPLEETDDDRRSRFRNLMFSTVMTVMVFALVHYSMTDRALWLLAGTGVLVALLMLLMKSRVGILHGLASVLLALGWMAVVVLGVWQIVGQQRPWLPQERLDIGAWWNTGVVYVLSSDEQWTKYLDDKTRTVRVVPTKNVETRYAVSGG